MSRSKPSHPPQAPATSPANDSAEAGKTDTILERNVEQLLTRAHEPPVMNPEARARVLANLLDRAGKQAPARPAPAWWPWRASLAGGGALALVAAVLVVARVGSHDPEPAQVYQNPGPAPERVTLVDGTEIVLNRDTRVVVTGERSLRIDRGDVILDVATTGAAFEVAAPQGRIVVLGTRFVVNAGAQATVASVMRGRVRIENERGQATLHAGQQGVLAADKAPFRRSAPRLSHLTSWAKLARRQHETPAAEPMRKGILMARNPQWQMYDYPLPLRALDVDVHVENQIARVAVDQTFFNAQPMELEGVYRFPLPPDAAISRLAMYVDGKRMEAAVVERTRGRQIYESIVYRRRDPALLEWMEGNAFQMRIFPLPARQEKRVVLSYTQALPRLYDDVRLEVPIPDVQAPVDRVRYRVTLVGCAQCQVRSTSHDIEVKAQGDDAIVTVEKRGYVIGDDLLLTVRDRAPRAEMAALRDTDAAYFMVRARPELPEPAQAPARRPRRWVIVHDTSASRGVLERKAQRFLIERLVREFDEDDEVNILAFDATVRTWRESFQRVADVDGRDMASFLAEQSGDGVGYTDLVAAMSRAAAMLDAARGHAEPYIVYLGDGVVTAGEPEHALARLRDTINGKATLVAVAVGEHMDATVLRTLATATGGMFTTMNPGDDLAWRAFDLIAALATPRVVDVKAVLIGQDGQPMANATVYASSSYIADGEAVDLVARWDAPDVRGVPGSAPPLGRADLPAAVELRGVTAGQPWTQRLALGDAALHTGALYLPRLWAMRRVAALMSQGAEAHQDEITALGTRHFLMTPYTSLLVLENNAMYRQYKVKRDRTPAWAAYPLPDRIDVVHEPLGTVATASMDPAAVLVRSPLSLLQSVHNAMMLGGLATGSTGMFVNDALGTTQGRIALARRSGVLGALGDFDRGGAMASLFAEENAASLSEDQAADVAMSAGDDDNAQPAATTTAELRARSMSWSANKSVETKALRKSAHSSWMQQGWGRGPGLVNTRGWIGHGSGGGGFGYSSRYGYYGAAALVPRALHYESDPRLDDLSEFVPGLFEDAVDTQIRTLRMDAGKGHTGSITDQARALVDKARERQGMARYRSADGQILGVDASGRFVVERTLPSGLAETIVYDGIWLYHRYAGLGLVTRRDMTGMEAVVYDHWLPFRVPSAQALSRWYHVSTTDSHTLRLSASRASGASFMEIVLDDDYRVIEVRTSADKGADVARRFEYQDGTLVLVQGRERIAIEVLSGQVAPVQWSPDEAQWTEVDMPLAQPAYLIEQAGREEQGSPGRRRMQRRLLAAYAALGKGAALWQTVQEMFDEYGSVSLGELVLASAGARTAPSAAALRGLMAVHKGSAVAEYLAASRDHARNQSSKAYAGLARRGQAQRSLVDMLARYRELLHDIAYQGNAGRLQARVVEFISRYPASPLAYIAAYNFNARWSWQTPERVVAVWDALASGPWADIAQFEAARVLSYRGRYDDAADRFDRLFTPGAGISEVVHVDSVVANAFRNSSRGNAGWRRFWIAWRDRVLAGGDPVAMADLVLAAMASGEHQDLDRVIARAIQLDLRDPEHALVLADAFMSVAHHTAAMTVLQPWLDNSAHDGPDDEIDDAIAAAMMWRASVVAEQQGRYAGAAELLARSMERDPATELAEVRAQYQHLIALFGRVAQSHTGTSRRDAVDRALAAVAAWRRVDPANPEIDRLAAMLLYSMARPKDAWRYLSTAIERAPMQGDSYQVVADVLEREGRLDRAEALWARAAEVEPTNPTWLLRRAQALQALGEDERAHALVGEIMSKKWHERFAGVIGQARALSRR